MTADGLGIGVWISDVGPSGPTARLYAAHRARPDSGASVERRAVAPVAIRRRDIPALGVMGLGLLLVTAPVLDLVAGSFRVQGGWGLGNYRSLGTVGEGSLVEASVLDALLNSLRTAVDATWMALLLGLLVSVIVTRRSHSMAERRLRGVLDEIGRASCRERVGQDV